VTEQVAVLGGGVAGLTTAHELAERGFDVDVYEQRGLLGGKARSYNVPADSPGCPRTLSGLPAEHGFRFFPAFYTHVPDTMRRIPYLDQPDGVLGNLVPASCLEMARRDQPPFVVPAHFPRSINDVTLLLRSLVDAKFGIPPLDMAFLAERLWILLTSCQERRYGEWEHVSWWKFSQAEKRSAGYRRYLADGISRSLVAARAREISTRTGGYIGLRLLLDMVRPNIDVDRVLCGPTNQVWIDPWRHYLEELGVRFHLGAEVAGIDVVGDRVTGVRLGGRPNPINADFFVAALPVEVMCRLLTPALLEAEPQLAELRRLKTRWMNGIMFYLHRDVPLLRGHTIYIDSRWSLTSISQAQFWPGLDFSERAAGQVGGILSVDISDWTTKGRLFKKPAMECTREEIAEEVWAQLKEHLDRRGSPILEDANRAGWFIDDDIVAPNPEGLKDSINLEPLLINTVGSWYQRPHATTTIGNLMLASDYVRTYTDLATMEGANEAARRAVNGILDAAGSNSPRCTLWPMSEPAIFAPFQAVDRVRFRLGQPHLSLVGRREQP
jgi:uncharacterized protein with NAD-binding domain and iron-sulfur cluster